MPLNSRTDISTNSTSKWQQRTWNWNATSPWTPTSTQVRLSYFACWISIRVQIIRCRWVTVIQTISSEWCNCRSGWSVVRHRIIAARFQAEIFARGAHRSSVAASRTRLLIALWNNFRIQSYSIRKRIIRTRFAAQRSSIIARLRPTETKPRRNIPFSYAVSHSGGVVFCPEARLRGFAAAVCYSVIITERTQMKHIISIVYNLLLMFLFDDRKYSAVTGMDSLRRFAPRTFVRTFYP